MTRVERFEGLRWKQCVALDDSTFERALTGDGRCEANATGGLAGLSVSENQRWREAADLPAAKRAAWDLLLELRAKAARESLDRLVAHSKSVADPRDVELAKLRAVVERVRLLYRKAVSEHDVIYDSELKAALGEYAGPVTR